MSRQKDKKKICETEIGDRKMYCFEESLWVVFTQANMQRGVAGIMHYSHLRF
jgi:hypothetical protein